MPLSFKNDFSHLTGAGVRIGIIDSGYAPGKRQIRITKGINFSQNGTGTANSTDFSDHIGHGTACAGIIYKKVPAAEIFPVKIFENELVSDVERLNRALEWCIENRLQVVNLSLGTTQSENQKQIEKICREAIRQQVVIVAAAANNGQASFPAAFPEVLGVTAGQLRGKYDYYFNKSRDIQFIARGDRQRLDWIHGTQIFLGGTSFAAPHVTAIIALILEKFPGIVITELMDLLTRYSVPDEPPLVDGTQFYSIPGQLQFNTRPDVKLSEVHQQNNISWIKRALIYPYNKEMHALIRYRDLLAFEISHVVDVVGKGAIGKDSGEFIGAKPSGIIVQKKIEDCLQDVDTIVLGYLDELSRIKRRDILKEMLELALRHEKNVYSLTPVTSENYPEVVDQFKQKNLHLDSPVISYRDYKNITQAFDWRESSQIPIVGIFGTSPQQGKFTTQLALRRELQKLDYKVGQLGTEHQSALFGFDFTFPNGYDGAQNVRIPMDLHVPLLQSAMVGIEKSQPHIIIVGGQSGIIPYSFAEKSPCYTLSSLILIFGTVPDAYILVVNSIDEFDYIQENINVLKGLGKGEVILLVFSDKKKVEVNRLGRGYVVHQPLTQEEIVATKNRLEDRFNIPATEIVSAEGRQLLVKTVEDYFAEE